MAGECVQFELAVSAYLDGELPRGEVRTLFLHLADCEQCRAFMDTMRAVERRVLKEERIGATKRLDQRVASIRPPDIMKVGGEPEPPLALRSVKREHIHSRAFSPDRRRVSYTSLAVKSLLAAAIGCILGVMQPWSYVGASNREPQIVYVSVLPSMTVIGHVNELDNGGKSK